MGRPQVFQQAIADGDHDQGADRQRGRARFVKGSLLATDQEKGMAHTSIVPAGKQRLQPLPNIGRDLACRIGKRRQAQRLQLGSQLRINVVRYGILHGAPLRLSWLVARWLAPLCLAWIAGLGIDFIPVCR